MRQSGFAASHLLSFLVMIVAFLAADSAIVSAQVAPERFWLAGRYDGNRVIVYFDAVRFGSEFKSAEAPIAPPVAEGFFDPMTLNAKFVDGVLRGQAGAEHFHLGERYELLLGHDQIATITLTSLVGSEGDEFVGNDSYIGALATVDNQDSLFASGNYYVVRRAEKTSGETPKVRSKPTSHTAGLEQEPVRNHLETQIAFELNQRWRTLVSSDRRPSTPPAVTIQPFYLADGSLRCYVRAGWERKMENDSRTPYALGAWMKLTPAAHMLAVERQTSSYDFENALPVLRNVVDLGYGKTGLVVTFQREDSTSLQLLEYRDGAALAQMRTLQAISAGE